MALYTPFLAEATGKIANSYLQKQAGQLAERAYMGDEQALGTLYKLDPAAATQIRNQKLQEEQIRLQNSATNLQMKATNQNMQQSAQEWALANRERIQGILQNAAKFETYEQAQPYIAQQIESLKAAGIQVPTEMSAETFTPEIFAQIKQLNQPQGEGFTLGQGETRFDAAGNQVASVAPKPEDDPAYKESGELRKEFTSLPVVKDFVTQSTAMGRIEASAADPSAAGDLALIFSYMKVLDPGSTVREGEFANAQSAGSVPARVVGLYNRVLNGERLSDDQRKDFLDRGTRLYKNAEQGYSRIENQYKQVAERRGLPADDVLVDFRYQFADPQDASMSEITPAAINAGVTPQEWQAMTDEERALF